MPLRNKPFADIFTYSGGDNGTYINVSGSRVASAADQKRLTHDPETLLSQGVLIESGATNLFLNSLVDGTNLATQGVTVTAAPYSVSFYGSGTITFTGAHTGSLVGTDSTTLSTVTFTPTAGTLTCTVTGTVFWAQIESGDISTSHIPTAGAAVTRTSDVLTKTLSDAGEQYPGGMQIDCLFNVDQLDKHQVIFQIDDGSESNSIKARSLPSGKIQLVVTVSSAETGASSIIDMIDATSVQVVGDPNDVVISADGETPVSTGIAAFPFASMTTLRVGSESDDTKYFNGTIGRITLTPIINQALEDMLEEDGSTQLTEEDGLTPLYFG